jgi:hypothetical protein
MEFPVVPWTDNVVPVQAAFAKRTADVIASVRNHPKHRILKRDGEFHVGGFDAAQRCLGGLLQGTNVKPVLVASHLIPTPQIGLALTDG